MYFYRKLLLDFNKGNQMKNSFYYFAFITQVWEVSSNELSHLYFVGI
jgi:xanthine dehydrogenase molybdopterin-binding subunit B